MRAEYKRDMNHNYLIFQEDIELDTSSYQVRMLVGNSIPSLLKCQFHGVDGKIIFHYDITSKQSIAVLYENKLLNESDLRLIFGSFIQVMEQMAEYLLNPGQVILQPEYMYMDVNKKEIYFCYLPGKEREVQEQFRSLTEYVLPKIDHGDEKAVLLGYGVYRRAMEESFHLEHVKEELFRELPANGKMMRSKIEEKTIVEDREETDHAADVEKNLEALFGYTDEKFCDENLSSREKEFSEKSRKKEKRYSPGIQQKIYIIVPVVGTIMIMAILAANMMGLLPWLRMEILLLAVVMIAMLISVICFLVEKLTEKRRKEACKSQWKERAEKSKEKVPQQEEFYEENFYTEKNIGRQIAVSVRNDYDETVILSAGTVRGPASLVSKEPGEFATIFLKEDLTVIGKLETAADAVISLPTISRLHAKIRKREEEYYLADLNSRNGTSVNGRILKVNEEYLLQDEDEVAFAEARYIFLK